MRQCAPGWVFHVKHEDAASVGANIVRPKLLSQAYGLPSPLIEEMPDRAEESFASLEKEDAR